MSFPINGANWWCRKNHQWATQSLHTPDKNLHNAKAEDLKRSTGVVPAKYPPMVKLEKSLVHNSRVLELGGNCAYFRLWGFWGFYSSVGLKSMPWSRSSFLIGENLFNPCIFRNPFLVGVFLIRGKRGAQDISLYTCTAPNVQVHLGLGPWINNMGQGSNLLTIKSPDPRPQ